MTSTSPRRSTGLATILLLGLLLLIAGAAVAVLALARYPEAARFFGIATEVSEIALPAQAAPLALAPPPVRSPAVSASPQASRAVDAMARVSLLEARLAAIEGAAARAEGSAVRADALLVAFAARRAIDRGVALGFLEPLLQERFGPRHGGAVATILTASRRPVRLDQLQADFQSLGPRLKVSPPEAGLWQNVRRELGSLVSIRRADQPSQSPSPTYDRAAARLAAGQVDQALAEAMRLPGIAAAPQWVADARIYIAAHRALDEIEGAALLTR